MSQKETILAILKGAGETWICTNSFYGAYIADPRTRLCELKKEGINLEWRWCQQHDHKKSKEWRLLPEKKEGEGQIATPLISEDVLTDMFGEGGKEEVKEYYQVGLF